eukprot:GGOE01037080.1.p1 GENE.GGOE01037080.1~~GGOE01037080.1.p1  ORF type:complete len:723 (+),score=132.33 GGOE01037080.1:100-2268(+)
MEILSLEAGEPDEPNVEPDAAALHFPSSSWGSHFPAQASGAATIDIHTGSEEQEPPSCVSPTSSPGRPTSSGGGRPASCQVQRPQHAAAFGLNPTDRYALSLEDVGQPGAERRPRTAACMPRRMPMPFWKRMMTDTSFRHTIQRTVVEQSLSGAHAFHSRARQSETFRWGLCLSRMANTRRSERHLELQQALQAYLSSHPLDKPPNLDHLVDDYWLRSAPKSTATYPERWEVALQNSRALTELAQQWWLNLPKVSGLITKQTYIAINVVMEGVLYAAVPTRGTLEPIALTAVDRTAVEAFVENDWHVDCCGKRRIDQTGFQRWLFSVLDLWTETYDVDEHVDFLQSLAVHLFDETGGLLGLVEAPEIQVEPLGSVLRGRRTQQRAERLLSADERRFLMDEPLDVPKSYNLDSVLAELTAIMSMPPDVGESPKSTAASSIPAQDTTLSSETDLIRGTSVLDAIISAARPVSGVPAVNQHGQAIRERNALVELAPPGARLVTLRDYNRRIYGTQPRKEGFTLERVCMNRLATNLRHSADTTDPRALLAYLRDHTIDRPDVQRIFQSDPALFDRFVAALSSARERFGTASEDMMAVAVSPPPEGGLDGVMDETIMHLLASRQPPGGLDEPSPMLPVRRPIVPRARSRDSVLLGSALQVTGSRRWSLQGDKGPSPLSKRPLGSRPSSPWRPSQALKRPLRPFTAPAQLATPPLAVLQLAPIKASPR